MCYEMTVDDLHLDDVDHSLPKYGYEGMGDRDVWA